MPTGGRDIEIVLFPGFQLLDLAGPCTVFEIAARLAGEAGRVRVVARQPGSVASSSGVRVVAGAPSRRRVDAVIVVGGEGVDRALDDRALIAALRRAPRRARRVASVCSGALLLAAAGLLDGRRATTHWRRATQLARSFPAVRVESDAIYIRDGDIWTSAGVSAGIDLALAMIALDHGDELATAVAREMVVYTKRTGGQAQHSTLLELDARGARFSSLHRFIREHLHENLSVERLAKQAAMSPRHFARLYSAHTGTTPARAVERLRLEAARAALGTGSSIQEIAQHTGFGHPERMRRAFIRVFGVPPAALRRARAS